MSINYRLLGLRIRSIRNSKGLSQEALSKKSALSREYIARIELGLKSPSVNALVAIANALCVSADDLLVDSLEHSCSTADSELHRLLLDCNDTEEQILIRTAEELKSILYALGI